MQDAWFVPGATVRIQAIQVATLHFAQKIHPALACNSFCK